MKKRLINYVKAISLPVGVYILFSILTGGSFGSMTTFLSIVRTSIVPILLGMSLSFGMSMGMWNFAAGAIIYNAAIFSANIADAMGLGIPGIFLFAILVAVLSNTVMGIAYNLFRVPCMVLSLGFAMIYEALPHFLAPDAMGRISILEGWMADLPWCLIVVAVIFGLF